MSRNVTMAVAAAMAAAGLLASTAAATQQKAEPAWKLVCPEAQPGGAATAAQPCSLIQNLVAGDQQQRLLTVILQRKSEGGHGLTIALPHGLLFAPGVTMQVDEAAETRLAVQTSDQNGAYTGLAVDGAMLAALKAGKVLKIGFTAGNGRQVVVPVTLKDFGTGLDELDSRPGAPTSI